MLDVLDVLAFGLAAAFGFAAVLAFAVAFLVAVDAADFAVDFFGVDVRPAVVLRVVAVDLPGTGGLMDEIVLAAFVSASAAVARALVAVLIVFMAVFIAWAEVVALLAASVIFVAADETFVAADDTLVAAAAGVTDGLAVVDFGVVFRAAVLVVFLAAALFFAPLSLARLALAVERRAVVVFVGTDPSPRVDQLRVDPFHIWRRSTHPPDAKQSLFPGMLSSG
ncbi:MAG: hypothetical protein JWR24_1454 [Actinoallomurus sp.]|nr:hypothetical protein [Actinoallomurus sp.]